MMNMSTLLGGMGGSTQSPMASLLGQYYNPADMKKQMLMNGIQQFGLGLLGQGYSPIKKGILGEIGTGIKAGVEGANQAKEDYEKSAFSAYSLDREMQQDKREEEEAARKEQERAQRAQALEGFYSQLDPSKRAFAQAFPEQAAPHFAKQMFPETQEPKAPTVQTFFDQKSGQEYKAQWDGRQWVPVGGVKAPSKNSGITIGPDGTVQIGGQMPAMNVEQAKSAGFFNRAAQVAPMLDKVDTALTDNLSATGSKIPGVGNYLKSDSYRQAEQLGREFLAPILRKDTGAAITSDEMTTYGGMYLPAPGDDENTIKQKREARGRAIESLKMGVPAQAILMMEMQHQQQGGTPPGSLSGKTSNGVPWSVE